MHDSRKKLFITPGYWEEYLTECSEVIERRNKRFLNSYMFQNLISYVKTGIEFTAHEQGISQQESARRYLRATGLIGKLTLLERSECSEKILEKMEKTKEAKRGYFAFCSVDSRVGYLFHFSNDSDRSRRKTELEAIGQSFALKDLPIDSLLCVGSTGAKLGNGPVDCLVINTKAFKEIEGAGKEGEFFNPPQEYSSSEWDS